MTEQEKPVDAYTLRPADEPSSTLWFTAVGTPSPMLLGLDWLEQAQATVDSHTGLMTFADGTPPEQLTKLSTGHWALALFDYEE